MLDFFFFFFLHQLSSWIQSVTPSSNWANNLPPANNPQDKQSPAKASKHPHDALWGTPEVQIKETIAPLLADNWVIIVSLEVLSPRVFYFCSSEHTLQLPDPLQEKTALSEVRGGPVTLPIFQSRQVQIRPPFHTLIGLLGSWSHRSDNW